MVLRKIGIVWAVTALSFVSTFGTTHRVPADYAAIQAAIDASVNHDTVLVSTGTYYENINFHAHNILVSSNFLLSRDPADISSTIINGSQQQDPDTGSCVLFISGEDSTAILDGFTLTGGTGTPLRDQSNGLRYVEGGGIMIENSAPIIRNNYIINNHAVRVPGGISSAGGGGLRAGWSNPQILNNIFVGNTGLYGSGIVINFAHGVIRNNVICQNVGSLSYGGAGVWLNSSNQVTLENNTITGNTTSLAGGGVRLMSSTMTAQNNIIWGNRAPIGSQIAGTIAQANLTYSCVQGGWEGTGNIGAYPQFTDLNLNLAAGSPCVDAGNPDPAFNDTNGTRNDMGAYGGPGANRVPHFSYQSMLIISSVVNFPPTPVGIPSNAIYVIINLGGSSLRVDSSRLGPAAIGIVSITSQPSNIPPVYQDTLRMTWTPAQGVPLADTLYLFVNDTTVARPVRITLRGQVSSAVDPQGGTSPRGFQMFQNFPNPFNSSTTISFSLAHTSDIKLSIFDTDGKLVNNISELHTEAGEHSVNFDGRALPSGLYFARLEADELMQTRKMVLLK